jgi:predicted dehydrogenase
LRTAAAATAASQARILGANERINVAVVGVGNRGYYLAEVIQKFPDAKITAVCDVFGEKCDRAAQIAPGAVTRADHRQVVERRDVDVVVVATPDHWHADICIDALNAGKDVYVEKPMTFLPEEGPAVIRAAEANQRLVQVGLQQRSGEVFRSAKQEIFDAGLLGKVSMVRTVWHYGPPFDLGDPSERKPRTLDWARFLGKRPWREWNPHQYHHWRLYLDFGGGCLTDLLVHWIDVVHFLLGKDRPRSVSTAGGVFVARDDRTSPDTANVLIDYDGFTVTFESAALPGMPGEHMVFYGTEGQLWLSRRRYEYTPKDAADKPVVFQGPDTLLESHVRNFLECCRSRKAPNCGPVEGHRAAEVCHLATEAYVRQTRIRLA